MTLLPEDNFHVLYEKLQYKFQDVELLQVALTHSSWCAENDGSPSNERLEFLGDAVLGMAVTRYIFNQYPELSEGKLSQLRALVVSSSSLSQLAEEIGVGSCLRLGKGQMASGNAIPPSMLEDAMEAIIGATFLDGGWEAAEDLVLRLLGERIEENSKRNNEDAKSRLQALAGQYFSASPEYVFNSEGPAHEMKFFVDVSINGRFLGHGEGRSKKEAMQFAAEQALDLLMDEEELNTDKMR
ncbi:MAG TPA: ribonuclease III [Acidimicrobiaceae bacterium]|nr:ribonuclease III [Acidimicrobiaceae bacterium]